MNLILQAIASLIRKLKITIAKISVSVEKLAENSEKTKIMLEDIGDVAIDAQVLAKNALRRSVDTYVIIEGSMGIDIVEMTSDELVTRIGGVFTLCLRSGSVSSLTIRDPETNETLKNINIGIKFADGTFQQTTISTSSYRYYPIFYDGEHFCLLYSQPNT